MMTNTLLIYTLILQGVDFPCSCCIYSWGKKVSGRNKSVRRIGGGGQWIIVSLCNLNLLPYKLEQTKEKVGAELIKIVLWLV